MFKKGKKKKQLKPAGKEFSLTEMEISSLVTYAKEMQIKQMEVSHWQREVQLIKVQITQRIGGDPVKHVLDDSQVFMTGKVYLQKRKNLPKVKVGKEEKKPGGKS